MFYGVAIWMMESRMVEESANKTGLFLRAAHNNGTSLTCHAHLKIYTWHGALKDTLNRREYYSEQG